MTEAETNTETNTVVNTDKSSYNAIIECIISSFKSQYPGYTIGNYDDYDEDDGISTPAMFIELLNFESANNKFIELFRVNATFRVYICESYRGNSKNRVKDTAFAVSKFIEGNNWGATNVFNNASFSYAAEDEFNEKIPSSEIWYCEWEQTIYEN